MQKEYCADLIQLLGTLPNDMIWITDEHLKTKYISPNVLLIRGISQEEALEERFEDKFTPNSQEIISKIMESVKFSLENNTPHKLNTIASEMYRSDGTIMGVEISFQIKMQDGKVKYIAGVTRDVSDRILTDKLNVTIELSKMFSDKLSQPIHVLNGISTLIGDMVPAKYVELMQKQLDTLTEVVRAVQRVNYEDPLTDPLYLARLNKLNDINL